MGGNYIFKERTYDRSTIKSTFIFQKEPRDCVRQWCKTNGTIKRYNWSRRRREKVIKKEKREKRRKERKRQTDNGKE